MSTSGDTRPVPTTQADAKVLVRTEVKPVVDSIGAVTTVQLDEPVLCNPRDSAPLYAYTYNALVSVDPAQVDAIGQTLQSSMAAKGYQVSRSPRTDEVNWYFRRADVTILAFFFPGQDTATVGGSGPCLPQES